MGGFTQRSFLVRCGRPLVLAACLGLAGCSHQSFGDFYRSTHPDFSPEPPRVGAGLAETVASLEPGARDHPEASLERLRLLYVNADPWDEIPVATLRASDFAPGPEDRHAVICERVCRTRRGLRPVSESRASWFLFEGGRLRAFDHYDFGEGCEPLLRFAPSPPGDLSDERAVARYVAQRFPDNAPNIEEQLERGRIYLEEERLEDARGMLAAADRGIAALTEQAEAAEGDDALELREREKRLRAQRAELWRSLERARVRGMDEQADPEERFWHGY